MESPLRHLPSAGFFAHSIGMTASGLGDRWLAGERVDGVAFAHNDAVEITAGRLAGKLGTVVLLMAVAPQPLYLVSTSAGDARVRQSELRATH